MTNSVRTREGREELRRRTADNEGFVPDDMVDDLWPALDGLDIAEEILGAIQHDGKTLTIHSNLPEALRRWQAWKEAT